MRWGREWDQVPHGTWFECEGEYINGRNEEINTHSHSFILFLVLSVDFSLALFPFLLRMARGLVGSGRRPSMGACPGLRVVMRYFDDISTIRSLIRAMFEPLKSWRLELHNRDCHKTLRLCERENGNQFSCIEGILSVTNHRSREISWF